MNKLANDVTDVGAVLRARGVFGVVMCLLVSCSCMGAVKLFYYEYHFDLLVCGRGV